MLWNCRNNPRLLGKSKAPSQQPHVTTRSPPSICPEDELIKAGFKCVEALDRIVIRGQSGGGAGVVVCLEQGADNSMTYTLFFIPDYQFQEVLLCFLR